MTVSTEPMERSLLANQHNTVSVEHDRTREFSLKGDSHCAKNALMRIAKVALAQNFMINAEEKPHRDLWLTERGLSREEFQWAVDFIRKAPWIKIVSDNVNSDKEVVFDGESSQLVTNYVNVSTLKINLTTSTNVQHITPEYRAELRARSINQITMVFLGKYITWMAIKRMTRPTCARITLNCAAKCCLSHLFINTACYCCIPWGVNMQANLLDQAKPCSVICPCQGDSEGNIEMGAFSFDDARCNYPCAWPTGSVAGFVIAPSITCADRITTRKGRKEAGDLVFCGCCSHDTK